MHWISQNASRNAQYMLGKFFKYWISQGYYKVQISL